MCLLTAEQKFYLSTEIKKSLCLNYVFKLPFHGRLFYNKLVCHYSTKFLLHCFWVLFKQIQLIISVSCLNGNTPPPHVLPTLPLYLSTNQENKRKNIFLKLVNFLLFFIKRSFSVFISCEQLMFSGY